MNEAPRLGVDLGGTKIEAVVIAGAKELARHRVPTDRDKGYEHVLQTTADAIAEVSRMAGVDDVPIGVGMPGGITRAGLIKNSNTTCLNGRPFRNDLIARVGRPIVFDNDANCFALAEATFGAVKDHEVVFGVIMGTGVGGGIVVRGRPWSGLTGIAGEWGHIPLEPREGRPCYCGRNGCVETILSGPAIERAYFERTGEKRSLRDIPEDDPAIDYDAFGRALAIVIDVLDPNAIVLGGGVSNVAGFYTRGREAVARWVFNDELITPIVKHAIGDSAGVLGAAMLTAP
jgi:fructokinase